MLEFRIDGSIAQMYKNILQQLYEGKIYPNENIGSDNPELHKMVGRVAEEKAKFIKSLSDNDRENFLKLDDLLDESAALYGYENFAHGFKLAVSLLVESLGDTGGITKKTDD